jgi:hypothetical protein
VHLANQGGVERVLPPREAITVERLLRPPAIVLRHFPRPEVSDYDTSSERLDTGQAARQLFPRALQSGSRDEVTVKRSFSPTRKGKTMKLKSLWLQGVMSCALGIGAAHANPFTVHLSAHVTSVDDPAGLLGTVAVGQAATGLYRYDTSMTNNVPGGPIGNYRQTSAGQAAVRIGLGSLVFQSNSRGISISVAPGVPQPYPQPGIPGELFIDSIVNVASSSLASLFVQDIRVDFQDPSGYAPYDAALPTDVPDLTRYTVATVTVTGGGMNNQGTAAGPFTITFAIDNAYVFPPSSARWSISPATGVFSPQQRVDAAILLPAGSAVQNVLTFIGGAQAPIGSGASTVGPPLSLCMPSTQNSQGQQVILCPNVLAALQPGMNQIDWQVQLMDGTVLHQGVAWDIVP